MGKKKIPQVVIKDEELVPTTLGIYSNKVKNPIGIFIVLIAFLLIAFFLPNIQSYVNKLLGKDDNTKTTVKPTNPDTPDNPDNPDNPDTPGDDTDDKYAISSDTTITNETYTINNIGFDGSTITYTITNNTSSILDTSDYYLEFYNEETTFLGRAKVGDYGVQAGSSVNSSGIVPYGSSQFLIKKIEISSYPNVELNYSESGYATLSCTKGIEKYNYIFREDKLIKVSVEAQENPTSATYYENMNNYQSKASMYNAYNGIQATVITSDNGYSYTFSIDLQNANIDDVEDDNIYKVKTSPKEIKFIQEAKGFTCN